MAKITPIPTDSELEILQLLWQNGPSTVRFVNEELNKLKEVGYTTTLKLMQIMLEKGILIRNDESRTHIYTSAISEDAAQKKLLDKFMDATFRGSAMKLVTQALGSGKTSQQELDEIKKLIEQLEGGIK
ncbi:MAG: BlaI/MecI/CopY family transcriptional regulator [Bacteroidota bacterium]|jgi:predicted transcriptional regulator|nr:BlaI/MecI/CopY family transcriptional regulator [Bacteroidota bacterium]